MSYFHYNYLFTSHGFFCLLLFFFNEFVSWWKGAELAGWSPLFMWKRQVKEENQHFRSLRGYSLWKDPTFPLWGTNKGNPCGVIHRKKSNKLYHRFLWKAPEKTPDNIIKLITIGSGILTHQSMNFPALYCVSMYQPTQIRAGNPWWRKQDLWSDSQTGMY